MERNSIIVISGANRLLSAAYIDAHREAVQRARPWFWCSWKLRSRP